jgi:hypothetical protein
MLTRDLFFSQAWQRNSKGVPLEHQFQPESSVFLHVEPCFLQQSFHKKINAITTEKLYNTKKLTFLHTGTSNLDNYVGTGENI